MEKLVASVDPYEGVISLCIKENKAMPTMNR